MDIKEHIKRNGSITVSEFMGYALPQYYSQQEPFGAKGDFTTAPQISQVFGEMLGIWVASMWIEMGRPSDIAIVEFGPGTGTLMQDFLRGTANVKGFHGSAEIHMVESSSRLQNVQKQNLNGLHDKISWHDNIATLPHKKSFYIGNEFFDALPIKQYVKTLDGWCERIVDVENNGEMGFGLSPVCSFSDSFDSEHPDAPEGSFLEINQAAISIMKDIAKNITEYGGGGVFIDYGYSHYGYRDTLQAVKEHKFHDVLTDIGNADVTAHVDFVALAGVLADNDINSYSIATQKDFLLSLGIQVRSEMLLKGISDSKKSDEIKSAVMRLIDPKQMGNLFKVLTFVG